MNDKPLKIEKRFFHQSPSLSVKSSGSWSHFLFAFSFFKCESNTECRHLYLVSSFRKREHECLGSEASRAGKYLDSDFSTLEVLPQTQQEYLVVKNEEIRELVQMMSKFKELLPLLDSDRFRSVLDKSEKLCVCFDFDIPDQPYLVNLSSKVWRYLGTEHGV